MTAARDLADELNCATALLADLVAQGAERAPTLAKMCVEMTGRLTRLPKSDDNAAMCDELSAAITGGPWTDHMRNAMLTILDTRAACAAPVAEAKPYQQCERWMVHQSPHCMPPYTVSHTVVHIIASIAR